MLFYLCLYIRLHIYIYIYHTQNARCKSRKLWRTGFSFLCLVLNFSSDSCAKKSTKYKTDSVSSLSVTKFAEYIVVDYGRIRHYQQNTCQRLVLYHN